MISSFLRGCRILIVEDFAPLSFFLQKTLRDAGADVVGPAATISDATKLCQANDRLSAALLDIQLHGGEKVWPVARILADNHVPFVFYTAYLDASTLPSEWAERPIVTKPAGVQNILDTLADAVISQENAARGNSQGRSRRSETLQGFLAFDY